MVAALLLQHAEPHHSHTYPSTLITHCYASSSYDDANANRVTDFGCANRARHPCNNASCNSECDGNADGDPYLYPDPDVHPSHLHPGGEQSGHGDGHGDQRTAGDKLWSRLRRELSDRHGSYPDCLPRARDHLRRLEW
ncbi:MAG: hypothetical protein HYY02_03810 [Chloroflexi bacterium]|nr:hypothetical protein [Chloroflexota bacterium]